jgi:hypothetical protein
MYDDSNNVIFGKDGPPNAPTLIAMRNEFR